MAANAAPRRAVRQPLNRARVIATAVLFIDVHGLQELSMRALGRQLGVEAMAVYRYVPSREDLLDGVVDFVVDELYDDPEVQRLPERSWQEYLVRFAHGVRAMALRHPQVFPLVATRPPSAPWVRPPLRSLRWVDSLLTGLMSQGFSELDVVYAYRAFSSFLLGHLLLEVSALGVDVGPVDEPESDTSQGDAVQHYPTLLQLAPLLAEFHFEREFQDSLHNLIDRLGPGTGRDQ